MKIFVSLPMSGRNDDEVEEEMRLIKEKFFPNDEMVNEVVREKHTKLEYIALAVLRLEKAELVVFVPEWKMSRGCGYERYICENYDIPYVDLPENWKDMKEVGF